ncbi:MAG: exodeoxyribonuclease V subunit alpha [Desulfobacteraceae bacterium]|jgi:exodeoxyribonuclease V alpha subunit|nr:exodeoxyribonuclease V subunit alpha [Desulfobacteraceae bacterium]
MELSLLDAMTLDDLLELGECPGDAAASLVMAALFAGLEEGSLCLDLDPVRFCRRVPEGLREEVAAALVDFEEKLAAGRYRRLVAEEANAYRPLVLDTSAGRRLLYFHKYHVHERRLKKRMGAFLGSPAGALAPDPQLDAWIEEIHSKPLVVRLGADSIPLRRDPRQVQAVRLAMRSPLSVISGGPGTGKTSLLVNLLRCLVRAGVPVPEIVLGAPTGRAAQRMTEAVRSSVRSIHRPSSADTGLLDLQGSTLHKLLGYRPFYHAFTYRNTNPLPASVVVVDEVSMVDVVMMDHFLQAVDPERTRLVLMGDKNQLPSVEAGAVFAEMIPDGERESRFSRHLVVLEKVYRSGGSLLELAGQARRGDFPPVKPVSFAKAMSGDPDEWTFVEAAGPDRWEARLRRWADHYYRESAGGGEGGYPALIAEAGRMPPESLSFTEAGAALLERIFATIERARILTLLRGGPYGCTAVNARIAGHLIPLLDPSASGRRPVFSGAPILVTRNDYGRGLFNGDVGVLIRDPDGVCRAYFRRAGGTVDFPVDLLPSWEPAFAMTVHKSQGSEFDDVLLALPDDENNRLLTREIVYTGITRARKRVIFHGTEPVLRKALEKKIQRESGLMW